MTRDERPLLADSERPSSEDESQQAEEEDALIAQQQAKRSKRGWPFWREAGAFIWAFLATVLVVILAVSYQQQQQHGQHNGSEVLEPAKPSGKRNLIFMVSDGMGPSALAMSRSVKKVQKGVEEPHVLDSHQVGQSRTKSSNSLITDSAAGATAFSCGFKSYNGAISILPDHSPCGTILEAAKEAGYMTGLVVTTRITDATPAVFASHVHDRSAEDSIARQMVGDHPLGRVVDLMLGGGRCHFLPKMDVGSCRQDSKDVIQMASDNGFEYIHTRAEFDDLDKGNSAKLPLLGLFAPYDIPYNIDRRFQNDTYPSLPEMAEFAVNALKAATRDSDKGFFLMVEGSRIDHAGHANDPAAHVHEVLNFDDSFAAMLNFVDEDEVEGVVVTTSDHETGGLATARQLHEAYPEYLWYPAVLANVTHSGEYMVRDLRAYLGGGIQSEDEIEKHIRQKVDEDLGIGDVSDQEIQKLMEERENGLQLQYLFNDLVSRRAQIGWTTHGHSGQFVFNFNFYFGERPLMRCTGADVNIYTSDPKYTTALRGGHENTEVGNFLRDYLDLDLEPITEKLKEASNSFIFDMEDGTSESWLGGALSPDKVVGHFDHYHGDFKRSLDCGCTR